MIQFGSAGMEHYHTSRFGMPPDDGTPDGQQHFPPPDPPPPGTFVPARPGDSSTVPAGLQSSGDTEIAPNN